MNNKILISSRLEFLTEDLYNKMLQELTNGGSETVAAKVWWEQHKAELIGIAVIEVIRLFNATKNKLTLMKEYDRLVASMSWKEKMEFLRGGIEELKVSNNNKIRTIAFLNTLMDIAPKVAVILLMFI